MIRIVVRATVLGCLLAAAFGGVTAVSAQPPSPITSTLYAFPGSMPGPFSAINAGTGLADHWLGDEAQGNPAAPPRRELTLSPALMRANRQDLAARNRHFDQTLAFFDAAGASIAYGFRSVGLHAYAYHPVLRLEDVAFERGQISVGTPPAVMQSDVSMREIRAGAGGSFATELGAMPLRFGATAEWTRRDDLYHTIETSGAPDAGEREVRLSGDGVGFQAGVRADRGDSTRGFTVGAALRFVPALSIRADQHLALRTGTRDTTVEAERESGWEGGLSVRYTVNASIRVLAGVGGRTATEWTGFEVTSGDGFGWSVAFDYRHPEDPWAVRLGLGLAQQTSVAESRAGVLGLGFSYRMGDTTLDVGALRRSLERAGVPRSFDDRVVVSLGFTL